jgi:hypothetical protein
MDLAYLGKDGILIAKETCANDESGGETVRHYAVRVIVSVEPSL